METINNLASAASKAVWGENQTANREPVSGVKGDTAHGEPYDAGNLATPQQEKVEQNYGQHGEERDTGLGRETGIGREAAVSKPTETTTTPATTSAPTPASKTDTSAGQNDTRAPEQTDKGNKDLHDVDDTSEGTDAKLGEGPGPRPIQDLAREHGGDAGNAPVEGSSNKPTEVGSEGAESSKSENQPHDPKEDEYVTASGFKAEGGDFDASNPGAGHEATRLMEKKGMHLGGKDDGSAPSHTESQSSDKHSSSHDDKKDKPSIGERIKAKLHKH